MIWKLEKIFNFRFLKIRSATHMKNKIDILQF